MSITIIRNLRSLVVAVVLVGIFLLTAMSLASPARSNNDVAPALGRPSPGAARLHTTYEGPASCANHAFLTGDTVGDDNAARLYAALCTPER